MRILSHVKEDNLMDTEDSLVFFLFCSRITRKWQVKMLDFIKEEGMCGPRVRYNTFLLTRT